MNLSLLTRNNKRTSMFSPLPVALPMFTAPSEMLYVCSSCLTFASSSQFSLQLLFALF